MKRTTLAIERLTQVELHPALGRDLVLATPENILLEHTKCSSGRSSFCHSLGLFLFAKFRSLQSMYVYMCYWPQRKNCTGFIKGVEKIWIINLNNF